MLELKELNLSSFDTKNVKNMMMMFADCLKLKELNLSSFKTKNVNIFTELYIDHTIPLIEEEIIVFSFTEGLA